MKKFLSLLFILGFVLYLKPEFKFPDGSHSMKIKYAISEGVIASVGQQGRLVRVTSESGKRYYIPVENILCIIEE
jgi:hypothetical protein